jgi:hypothetical protein
MSNHIVKSNETPAQDENNRNTTPQPPSETQRIPKQGEEYLKEGGKIEDYPTPDGSNAPARKDVENATYGMKRSYNSIY